MRPFRILGVQQIAIGGPSKAALANLWVDLLGLPVVGTFRSERENVDEDILSIAGVEIDLMEPIDPAKSPRSTSRGSITSACGSTICRPRSRGSSEQGVRFTPGGIRKGAAGHDVCFIHPKGDAQHRRCPAKAC